MNHSNYCMYEKDNQLDWHPFIFFQISEIQYKNRNHIFGDFDTKKEMGLCDFF